MIAVVFAALIAQAQPQAAAPPAVADAQTPIAPEAQGALDAYRAKLASARARHAAEGPSKTVAEELRRRVELEQLPRRSMADLWSIAGGQADRDRVEKLMGADMAAIDAYNLSYLKRVLPADSWFRKSRDGEQAVKDAWLILHHAADDDFLERTFVAMEPLARMGEIDGRSFAFTYDRHLSRKGRPLRYGMHASCIDGYKAFDPIEDRANVDTRRKALGLKSLAASAKDHNIGNWCGGAAAVRPLKAVATPVDAPRPTN